MKFRRLLLVLALIGTSISVWSRTVVTDAETGAVLPSASVFDKNGSFVCITDDKGCLPEISSRLYPLNVRYLGFEPAEITDPGVEEVRLHPSDYELADVEIVSESHNNLHMLGYLRMYSSQEAATDTVFGFREMIVDYMIPTGKKNKVKGWVVPRVLATREAYRFFNDRGLDSISDSNNNFIHWNLAVLTDKTKEFPQKIVDDAAQRDTLMGKYGPRVVWWRIGDKYYAKVDALADEKDHVLNDGIDKFFGMGKVVTRKDGLFIFDDENGSHIGSVGKMDQLTYNYDATMTGKLFKKYIFDSDIPVDTHTYGELFIFKKEYLTKEEANDVKKHPPVIREIKAPEGTIPIHPAIPPLLERLGK